MQDAFCCLNWCLSRTDPPAKTGTSRSNNCSLFAAARLPDGWEAAQPRLPLPGSGERPCPGRARGGSGLRLGALAVRRPRSWGRGWGQRGTGVCACGDSSGTCVTVTVPLAQGTGEGHTLGKGHEAPSPRAGRENRGCHEQLITVAV